MLEAVTTLVGAVGSVVGLTKGATDVAKDIKTLVEKPDVDAAATQKLVSDLLDRLIRLQAEQIAMQSTILDFREEQRRIDRFQAEADRYALWRSELGGYVRALKPSHANDEPAHSICASCYERQIKSILQRVGFNTLGCGVCGGEFLVPDGETKIMMVHTGRDLRTGYNVLDPYDDD